MMMMIEDNDIFHFSKLNRSLNIKSFHAFSYESSKTVSKRMQSYIGCICLLFPHCAIANVSSNHCPVRRHSYIGCIYMAFLQCVSLYVSLKHLDQCRHSQIGCICLTFSTVCFQMSPQIACAIRMHSNINCIC